MINYWEKFDYGSTYHLYNKSIGSRILFSDEEDYSRFLLKFDQYFGTYINLYAYCLIPNHFHFLFRVLDKDKFDFKILSKENTTAARKLITDHSQIDLFFTDQLRRWYSSTALFLNRKYNETGQVFLEKTKRVSINTYEKFCSLLCYIHHNPIHHGLSKTYEEWPFSSFQEYIKPNPKIPYAHTYYILGTGDKKSGKEYFFTLHDDYKINFDREEYRNRS